MTESKKAGVKGLQEMADWVMANLDPQADREEVRKQSVEELKKVYDSFVAAGFTDEQAMELLLTIVSAMIAGGRA